MNRLGVVVGVERSLEDPCREDDAVLSGHVVGIDCGRSHAPPGGRGGARGGGAGRGGGRGRGVVPREEEEDEWAESGEEKDEEGRTGVTLSIYSRCGQTMAQGPYVVR